MTEAESNGLYNGAFMSSPIYSPDKTISECKNCLLDCAIKVSSAAKYMEIEPRPKCGCPFGIHKYPINWIQ